MNQNGLGDLLATDDEVKPLKSKAAKEAAPMTDQERITKEPRVRIILEENDNIPPTGQFIQINGVSFMLRPGEEADVPKSVCHVLDLAVEEMPQVDPATRQVIGYRKKKRFPYSVVQPVTA